MTGHFRHMASLRADRVHAACIEMRTGPVSSLTSYKFLVESLVSNPCVAG